MYIYRVPPTKKSKLLSSIISAATFLVNFEYKISTRMLWVRVKYSIRDLICDVISCCVFEAATRVKSMYVTKSWLKTRKIRENMEIKEFFLHKSPSKRWFRNGIHSLLSRADARGHAHIICRIWRILLLCRSGIVIDVKKVTQALRAFRTPAIQPHKCAWFTPEAYLLYNSAVRIKSEKKTLQTVQLS